MAGNLPISGTILEEDSPLSLGELSRVCHVHAEFVVELVEEGILDPLDWRRQPWVFGGDSLKRVRTVLNLQRDLGVNLAGVAVALELLDEMDRLRTELLRHTGA